MSESTKPVLWHIRISHYSEKARWALGYKNVEHDRRAPPPGLHMAVALWLTRGAQKTFPVLELGGRHIGDSTAIIAALEETFPSPPLYPEDPGERERALELEDWFDEGLGPDIRLLAWHEALLDREKLAQGLSDDIPPPLRRLRGASAGAARYAGGFVNLRYGVNVEEAAERARGQVIAALDHLEAELDGNEYLVGDRFTVADLTAAALFYPLVLPPEGPRLPDPTERFEHFRGPLKDRPGYRWAAEMFRRHRKARAPASAVAS